SIAEPDGEVAQPALVAYPEYGAARHALPELLVGPGEQLGQLRGIQAVAHPEIRLGGDLRVAVPGPHQLAIVASVDPVADQGPDLDGDAPLELDREVRDAAPRVEPVGGDDRARRADVDALAAAAAVRAHGSVHRERQVRIDIPEEEHRSGL